MGFGQREGAFVLNRVLRRHDEERFRHLVRDPVHRHLPLLHCFEQRGLRLRRRPVDLVCEDHLRDDWPRPELKVTRFLVVNRDAAHIAWQQVGRELNTPEAAARRDGKAAGEDRLADARHVLDEDVALAHQRDQR